MVREALPPVDASPGEETRAPRAWARLGVTPRSLLISLFLAPLNAGWLYQMQEVQSVGNPTILSLYFNVLFILCVLVLLNAAARRVVPRLALSQAELLVVYTLLSIATSCGAYDFIHWLVPDIAGVAYRATPENRWQSIFFQYLPRDMTMRDKTSLKYLYEGGTSFFTTPAAWKPWVTPGLWWIFMLSVLWLGPLGPAVLLRRRWMEVERLTYPIIQLPFELTRERSRMFASTALWTAFGIAVVINLCNGLKVLNPAFPAIPVKVGWDPGGGKSFEVSTGFTSPPWNAASQISLSFYPIIIGFGLLLPTELAISCVVFFFIFKAQLVAVSWLGIRGKPEFPFLKEQSLGGYLGILLFSLWVGRSYYREMLRRVFRKDPQRDSREPMAYRSATLLFLGCFAVLVLLTWCAGPEGMRPGSGMGLFAGSFFWGVYYLLTLVCGRIRAEMGLPVHEIERLGPTVLLGNSLGVLRGGAPSQSAIRNLTVASLLFGITRGMRSIAFPHQAEGLKLMERSGGDQKRLFRAMAWAVVLGMIISWVIYLPVLYHYGAGTAKMKQYSNWHTDETYNQLVSWIEAPQGVSWSRIVPSVIGLVFYMAMMFLKTNVGWWPLHPVGFALSSTWYMHHMWCPLLIAWLVKWLVTRYAGHSGTRNLVPIAFGLILGDTISGCLWTIYGSFTQKEVYAFWN